MEVPHPFLLKHRPERVTSADVFGMMTMPVSGYDNPTDLGIVWTALRPWYGSGTGQHH